METCGSFKFERHFGLMVDALGWQLLRSITELGYLYADVCDLGSCMLNSFFAIVQTTDNQGSFIPQPNTNMRINSIYHLLNAPEILLSPQSPYYFQAVLNVSSSMQCFRADNYVLQN